MFEIPDFVRKQKELPRQLLRLLYRSVYQLTSPLAQRHPRFDANFNKKKEQATRGSLLPNYLELLTSI